MTKLTPDDGIKIIDELMQRRAGNGASAAGNKRTFILKPFDSITLSREPSYLVKDILPRSGLAVVWGPPKCGKSFWLFDLMMHVALGWAYRGHRVQQGPVVYLALEGSFGFRARIEAWRREHLADYRKGVPFYLIDVPVNLASDYGALIGAITDQIDERPIGIVIDTLNRALVGDENKSDDMAKFLRGGDMIRTAFDCLAATVHHCGIQGNRPRGHTSLSGADDVQISVERDAVDNIICRVEHAKDGEAGATVVSRLERVELGEDVEGDPISSCVIVPVEGAAGKKRKKPKLGAKAAAALKALNDCIAHMGKPAPASNHIPRGVKGVTLAEWRLFLFKHNLINRDGSYREEFRRLHVTLKNAEAIGIWDDFVWAVT
jgi:hypothetical protein